MSTEIEKLILEKLCNIEEKLEKVEERLDNMEERLIKVEERLYNMEEKLIKVEERLNNIDEELKNVDQRLSNVEEKTDIMVNINTAKIINVQTKNHFELLQKIENYEDYNEIEHDQFKYEISKLKA